MYLTPPGEALSQNQAGRDKMHHVFYYPRLMLNALMAFILQRTETALQDGACSLLHSCAARAAQALLQRQGHGAGWRAAVERGSAKRRVAAGLWWAQRDT